MQKTDTSEPSSDPSSLKSEKLMTELDELVDFLADGPEVQQEMRLPQEKILSKESTSAIDKVPVLTAPVDQQDAAKLGVNYPTDIDQLVDALVDQILPKLESELRRRLKAKISESNS